MSLVRLDAERERTNMTSFTREELIDTLGLLLAQKSVMVRLEKPDKAFLIQSWIAEISDAIKNYKDVA